MGLFSKFSITQGSQQVIYPKLHNMSVPELGREIVLSPKQTAPYSIRSRIQVYLKQQNTIEQNETRIHSQHLTNILLTDTSEGLNDEQAKV